MQSDLAIKETFIEFVNNSMIPTWPINIIGILISHIHIINWHINTMLLHLYSNKNDKYWFDHLSKVLLVRYLKNKLVKHVTINKLLFNFMYLKKVLISL